MNIKKKIQMKMKMKMKNSHQMNQKMEVKQLLLCMEIQINNRIFNRIQIITIINQNFFLFNNKWVQDRIKFSQDNLIKFKNPHFRINKLLECFYLRIIFQINNKVVFLKYLKDLIQDNKITKINFQEALLKFLNFLKYQILASRIILINLQISSTKTLPFKEPQVNKLETKNYLK